MHLKQSLLQHLAGEVSWIHSTQHHGQGFHFSGNKLGEGVSMTLPHMPGKLRAGELQQTGQLKAESLWLWEPEEGTWAPPRA